MGAIASQITSLTIVYSSVDSDTDQRKYQSSASLAFVRGIHRRPVNSPHKWPVTWKMFPFDDVIMDAGCIRCPDRQTVGSMTKYRLSENIFISTMLLFSWLVGQEINFSFWKWQWPIYRETFEIAPRWKSPSKSSSSAAAAAFCWCIPNNCLCDMRTKY